jgi:hypothetical protein
MRHVVGLVGRQQSHTVCELPPLLSPERLGGRVRAPGESLALRCQQRRRPWASFSFLIALFGSSDPLPTRRLKVLRVKT